MKIRFFGKEILMGTTEETKRVQNKISFLVDRMTNPSKIFPAKVEKRHLKMALTGILFINLGLVFNNGGTANAQDAFDRIKQFGKGNNDTARGVSVNPSGVYVVGEMEDSSAEDVDAFVRKYSTNGKFQWKRSIGTGSTDIGLDVSSDITGIYAVGWTGGNLEGESLGNDDAFIRKYDADGNKQWTNQFGTTFSDVASGVSSDATGVYVVGRRNGTLFDIQRPGSAQAYIRKYNNEGELQWEKVFEQENLGSSASDVSADTTGIYVVGILDVDLNTQTGNAFIRKYDSDGNEQWTDKFDSSPFDPARGVSSDSTGIYVITFETIRKYDSNGNLQWTRPFGSEGISFAEGISSNAVDGINVVGRTIEKDGNLNVEDAFILKYDTSGNLLSTNIFGTQENDIALDVGSDTSGIYIVGGTLGDLSGPSKGDEDAFLAILGTTGEDRDNDGILDNEDICPDSDLTPTVVINDCDSGVENQLLKDGCTISDLVKECEANTSDAREFEGCITQLTETLKNEEIITSQQVGEIQQCSTPPTPPDSDLNGDGCIDGADLDILLKVMHGTEPQSLTHDLNGDGEVNVADARFLITSFTNPSGRPCNL